MASSRTPRLDRSQRSPNARGERAWSQGAPLFLGASVAGLLGAVVVYLLQPEPLSATETNPSPPAAIAVLWEDASDAPPQQAPAGRSVVATASPSARSARLPGAAAVDAEPATAATPGAPPAAPLLTLAQLLELKAALARNGNDVASDGGGDAPGAFGAAADQLLFTNARQRFLQLQMQTQQGQGPPAVDPAERRALADLVDEGLEARLQRRDIALADARALKALVLEAQEADAEVRAARLQRWTDAQASAAAATAPSASAVPRAPVPAASASPAGRQDVQQ